MQPEDITRFNPWWTTGKVQRELAPAYKKKSIQDDRRLAQVQTDSSLRYEETTYITNCSYLLLR